MYTFDISDITACVHAHHVLYSLAHMNIYYKYSFMYVLVFHLWWMLSKLLFRGIELNWIEQDIHCTSPESNIRVRTITCVKILVRSNQRNLYLFLWFCFPVKHITELVEREICYAAVINGPICQHSLLCVVFFLNDIISDHQHPQAQPTYILGSCDLQMIQCQAKAISLY